MYILNLRASHILLLTFNIIELQLKNRKIRMPVCNQILQSLDPKICSSSPHSPVTMPSSQLSVKITVKYVFNFLTTVRCF